MGGEAGAWPCWLYSVAKNINGFYEAVVEGLASFCIVRRSFWLNEGSE